MGAEFSDKKLDITENHRFVGMLVLWHNISVLLHKVIFLSREQTSSISIGNKKVRKNQNVRK